MAGYLDDYQAYSVNEVAVNWNAPLAWLAGGGDVGEAPVASARG